MIIIDTTTVSVLLAVVALAVFAAVIAFGISHLYLANRPARAARSSVPTVGARLAAAH